VKGVPPANCLPERKMHAFVPDIDYHI